MICSLCIRNRRAIKHYQNGIIKRGATATRTWRIACRSTSSSNAQRRVLARRTRWRRESIVNARSGKRAHMKKLWAYQRNISGGNSGEKQ